MAVGEVILDSASYRDAVNAIVKELKQVSATVELLEECEGPMTRKGVYDVTGRGGKTVKDVEVGTGTLTLMSPHGDVTSDVQVTSPVTCPVHASWGSYAACRTPFSVPAG